MTVRTNRSITHYLQRKKVLPELNTPRPKYEMRTGHPHDRPVKTDPRLLPVDSPGTKVVTQTR